MHIIYMTDYLTEFDAFSQEQCKKFLKQRDFRDEQLLMGIVTMSLDGNGISTLPPMSKKRFKHNLAVRFGDVSEQKVDTLYNDSRRGTSRQSFAAFGGLGGGEGDADDNDGEDDIQAPEPPFVATNAPPSVGPFESPVTRSQTRQSQSSDPFSNLSSSSSFKNPFATYSDAIHSSFFIPQREQEQNINTITTVASQIYQPPEIRDGVDMPRVIEEFDIDDIDDIDEVMAEGLPLAQAPRVPVERPVKVEEVQEQLSFTQPEATKTELPLAQLPSAPMVRDVKQEELPTIRQGRLAIRDTRERSRSRTPRATDDDEVIFDGERSVDERNRAGFAQAQNVDIDPDDKPDRDTLLRQERPRQGSRSRERDDEADTEEETTNKIRAEIDEAVEKQLDNILERAKVKQEERAREVKREPEATTRGRSRSRSQGRVKEDDDEENETAEIVLAEIEEFTTREINSLLDKQEQEERAREVKRDPEATRERSRSRDIKKEEIDDDEPEYGGELTPKEALAERNSLLPVVSIDDDEEEERPRRQPVTKVEFKGAQKRAETRLAKAKETKLDSRLKITNLADIGGSELVTIREETDNSTIIMPLSSEQPESVVVKLENPQNVYQISDRKTGEKKDEKLTAMKVRQIEDYIKVKEEEMNETTTSKRKQEIRRDIFKMKRMRGLAKQYGVIDTRK